MRPRSVKPQHGSATPHEEPVPGEAVPCRLDQREDGEVVERRVHALRSIGMDAIAPSPAPASAALRCLIAAGVPIAGVRGPLPDAGELAHAVRAVMREHHLEPWVREAVAAWVMAWSDEWPAGFRQAFDAESDAVAEFWRVRTGDRNRYLKLRRIAIANLATVL